MSSLSDFVKKFPKNSVGEEDQKLKEKAEEIKQGFSQTYGDGFNQTVNNAYERFGNMEQSQLQEELFKEASRLKQSGNFDYHALQGVIEGMQDYISPQQKQAMLNLLERLK